MGSPLLSGGQVRTRLVALAVILSLSMLYLVYRQPLSFERVVHEGLKGFPQPEDAPKAQDSYDVPIPERPIPDGVPTVIQAVGPAVTQPADTSSSSGSSAAAAEATPVCKSFESLQWEKPGPLSEGKRKFPYVRPPPECRTFVLPSLEALLARMKKVIRDPDLFRLFENSYPNTLDTMVKWKGYANHTDAETGTTQTGKRAVSSGGGSGGVDEREELTYLITGDIDAMWLRDSASQLYSYKPLLEASTSPDSLASLWRGLINAHARYISISPYCHSFQPPEESGIPPTVNGAYSRNNPQPGYNPQKVFDCKWELDSLASFLQISAAYHERTGDAAFFGRFGWVDAVEAAVDASAAMRRGTYDEATGKVLPSAWTFTGWTNRGSETLTNDGLGNPTRSNGMVRSAFRPSDDATVYQLLVPANMMFAKQLEEASNIMELLPETTHPKAANLTLAMRDLAAGIRAGIDADAVVRHKDLGDMFAYEVDGFGSANLMDDANVPSLLAFPLYNYTSAPTYSKTTSKTQPAPPPPPTRDLGPVYRNTRSFALSSANPYFARGPVLSAVGGPHLGPGKGWPMAAIVAAMTALDPITGSTDPAADVEAQLRMLLDSTSGTGVIHETVNAWNEQDWTRSWFGWANGLFGELILKIHDFESRSGKSRLLGKSWQD